MVKAAFFDIDGTLVSFKTHTMPESTKRALAALRRNGVKVFIATGRAPNNIEFIKKMFDFDGFVCFNGLLCFDADGTVLYDRPLPRRDIDAVLPYMNERKIACCFEMADRQVFNLVDQRVRDLLAFVNMPDVAPEDIVDVSKIAKSFYQLSAYVLPEEEADLMRHMPDCKAMRWHELFVNIVGKDGGKPVGIAKVCEKYGYGINDVIAFGDGGNDIDMLKSVGIGVAMGNAGENVKEIADYVTTSVDGDGIRNALKHFELI